MRKRGVIFDLDGTLIDSKSGPARIVQIAQSLGWLTNEKTIQDIRARWGKSPVAIVKDLWPNNNVQEFIAALVKLDTALPHPLLPGARETLWELRVHGLALAILTARGKQTTLSHLAHHGLTSLFGFVQTRNDWPWVKPDPRGIVPTLHYFRRLGIFMPDLLYVGDTANTDWKLAEMVGVDFVAVTTGETSRADFLQADVEPDRILQSVADLPQLLK